MLFDGIISSTLHQPLGLTGTITGVENGDIHQPTGLVDEIIVSSSTDPSKRGWVIATLGWRLGGCQIFGIYLGATTCYALCALCYLCRCPDLHSIEFQPP